MFNLEKQVEGFLRMIRATIADVMMSSLGKRPIHESYTGEAKYIRTCLTKANSSPKVATSARSRPTHFLALPVNHSSKLHKVFSDTHKSIVSHSPFLKQALVEAQSAHITLGVLHLNENDIIEVSDALDQWNTAKAFNRLQLDIGNLNQFKSGVLYLEVQDSTSNIFALEESIHHMLCDRGFLDKQKQSFTPHVTVAKLSKLKKSQKRGRKNMKHIHKDSYKHLSQVKIGNVEVSEVQLCAMQGRNAGEYYPIVHSVSLSR